MGKYPARSTAPLGASGRARARWAAEAARLLALGQASDFAHACRKSAARLRIARTVAPLAPAEVAAALATHQRLFGGARHHAALTAARRATCEALRALAAFNPIAIGAIVDGSLTAHADIALVVYADDEVAVMDQLHERGIPTVGSAAQVRTRGERGVRYPGLRFRAGAHGFSVAVLPVSVRGHALVDRYGQALPRADLAALARLVWAD